MCVFSLASGNADFPFLLGDYHVQIMPSEGGKADRQSGIGVGACRIESFEPGVRIDMAGRRRRLAALLVRRHADAGRPARRGINN